MSFFYEPLSLERQEIRLIHATKRNLPIIDGQLLIEYSIEHVSLEESPEYVALSYVWGNPKENLPIKLNGNLFRVTENLHSALLELRSHSSIEMLWVDAICINQE